MSGVMDYGQTREAQRRRKVKAQMLARAAWDQGWRSADIPGLDPVEQRRLSKVAKVNVPGEGSTSWDAVQALVARMEIYVQANPAAPQAQRPPRPDLPVPDGAPRGWAALAASKPDTGQHCQIGDCGRRAIKQTPVRGGRPVWRCAGHPPMGDDWGVHLNWAPTTTATDGVTTGGARS
jgi:hypothetical protein